MYSRYRMPQSPVDAYYSTRYMSAAPRMGPITPVDGPRYYRTKSLGSPRRRQEDKLNTPRTVDVIGNGIQLTVKGHIDLLRHLPVHHSMHRELIETFRKKPGNYEGVYNNDNTSRATVSDLGNGYLSINFSDDITQPELSEFLVGKGWVTLAVYSEGNKTYEKWTNVLTSKTSPKIHRPTVIKMPQRYY